MEDLSIYTEEELYEMLEEGTISIKDLDYYIKNGTIDAETLKIYLKDGLIKISDLDAYIKMGTINTTNIASYINSGAITVDDVAEYIKTGVIDTNTLSIEVRDASDTKAIKEIEETSASSMVSTTIAAEEIEQRPVQENTPLVEAVEPVVEEPEQPIEVEETEQRPVQENTPPVETVEPVVEESEPQSPAAQEENLIETPELVKESTENTYVYFENDANSYDAAKYAMEETYRYCIFAGMTIKDISLDGKSGRGPYISFEINNESKQMLNNLMRELYANNDGISLEFMRSMSTKAEMFTIEVDPANMSREEFYNHVKNTFQTIYDTIQNTRKDLDYEQNMPDGLKHLKERFRNDDPDIGQDFTIGYVRNDGKDSYYIVADNNAKALEYARTIGYDIKNKQGSNVFELETHGNVTNTKLEEASIDLSGDPEVTDVATFGVSELDIYGNLEQDPRVEMIENFIETSNDPHLLCILDIEVPANNPNQRVVTMKSEMGGSETVVFSDGQAFDQKVMPQIINTYAENNSIETANISTTSPDALDRASCQVESENNTILSIRGYDEASVNRIVYDIESKKITATESKENVNARQKTIGTYPNNNDNEQAAAFVSMPVLFVICVLFILVISLIIFAS